MPRTLRTSKLIVRLLPWERDTIHAAAESADTTLSDFARATLIAEAEKRRITSEALADMPTPVERVTALLQRDGSNYRCPAHGDGHGSLSVSTGRNGGAVLHCHAGCETRDVLAAIGWLSATCLRTTTPGEHRCAQLAAQLPRTSIQTKTASDFTVSFAPSRKVSGSKGRTARAV